VRRVSFTVAVALALCVTGVWGKAPTPVRSLLEIRHANVVVQKWDISCGAAALATVLTYQHGDSVSEREVAQAMLGKTDPLRVKVRGGFSLLDLKRYAEGRGFVGEGYTGLSLSDLKSMGPAIVPVVLEGYPHFVVFRGVAGDRVLLADPAFGNRAVDTEVFERAWQQQMGFIVKRRDGRPAPNQLTLQPHDLLRASPDIVRTAVR
jgi:uncharacterized protein